jgi:hypothetical protein
LRAGSWQGPIESGYGWHLIFADSISPSRVPTFEEVEPDVKSAWIEEQRDVAKRKNMKYLPIFRHVRDSYLSDQNRPASTAVAISGLAREGALLEVEAIAVLPAAEQTSPTRKEVARPGRSNRAPKRTSRPRRR